MMKSNSQEGGLRAASMGVSVHTAVCLVGSGEREARGFPILGLRPMDFPLARRHPLPQNRPYEPCATEPRLRGLFFSCPLSCQLSAAAIPRPQVPEGGGPSGGWGQLSGPGWLLEGIPKGQPCPLWPSSAGKEAYSISCVLGLRAY